MDKILTVLTPPFILMTPLPLTMVFYDGARIVFCSFMKKIFRPVCCQKNFCMLQKFYTLVLDINVFPLCPFFPCQCNNTSKNHVPKLVKFCNLQFFLFSDCNVKRQMNLLLLKETPRPSISKFAVSENLSPTKQELL